MKKIVIIGANNFQNPLILKAKQLGYETHVFAWKDGSIGEKTADYFYPISIVEKDKILEKCKEIKPIAICSIASDLATNTVNYVAKELGLPCNNLSCTKKSTNKFLMRQAFKENGVPTPGFEIIDKNMNLEILDYMKYPLIVKPTDRSGSRSITKIHKKDELIPAIKLAQKDSFENKAIVEEFIEGEEFSIEGISYNGKHNFLAITRKKTTGAPHFIETGHIEPAGLTEEINKKVKEMITKALDALEVENSASHSEFKITPTGDIRIIEIGARMGGDCIGSDLVEISTGYDFKKMVIDVAIGNKPDFTKVVNPRIAVIKFIFNEKDLEKIQEVESKNPKSVYFKSKIEKINSHEVKDSSTRFGYYIFAFEKEEEVRWDLFE